MKRVLGPLLLSVLAVACTDGGGGGTSGGGNGGSSGGQGSSGTGSSGQGSSGQGSSGQGSSGQGSSGQGSSGQGSSGQGSSGQGSSGQGSSGASSGPITRDECLPAAGGGSSGSSGTAACTENAANEPNDTRATAKAVTLTNNALTITDGSCAGAGGATNDDYFRVSVPAGAGFRATLNSPSNGGEDLDLTVLSTDGTPLGVSLRVSQPDETHPTEVVQLTLFPAATDVIVFVQNYGIESPFGAVPVPTSYTLLLEALPGGACVADVSEPNETAAAAKNWPLTQVDMVEALVLPLRACPNDVDFHKFTVANAGPAQVRVKTSGMLSAEVQPAGGGTALATASVVDGAATLDFTATAGGSYVLKVSGAAAPGADYSIEFTKGNCAAETPTDNTEATARALPLPQNAAPSACQEDADYLKFTTTVAGGLTVTLAQGDFSQGELRAIVFPAGGEATPLATTGAFDRNEGIAEATFTAAATTTYFVKVTNPSGRGDIRYAVGVSGFAVCEDEVDEPNDTPATATAIVDGATDQQVHCGSANADHFKFSSEFAGATKVNVRRAPEDAVLNVAITAGGTAVTTTSTTEGDTVSYAFTATAATEYVVAITNPAADKAVAYLVTLEPALPPVSANDLCSAAVTLTANQSVTGNTGGSTSNITVDDPDWCIRFTTDGPDVFYSVTIPANGTLTATLTTTDEGADFQLYLLDSCSASCCWAGVDDGSGGDDEVLSYRNSTSASQTLLLVVDGFRSDDRGAFGLEVSVQ